MSYQGLYEYLLIIEPSESVTEKLMQVKKDFHQRYKAANALNMPRITLCTFTQYKTAESRILSRVRNAADKQDSINVELCNFGCFPSHTIYVNVISRAQVLELVREVRQATHRMLKPDNDHKPYFISEPHLTICKGLTNEQYEQAWKYMSNLHFYAKFTAQSMLLLRREKGGKYHRVEHFTFKNKKTNVVQAMLF